MPFLPKIGIFISIYSSSNHNNAHEIALMFNGLQMAGGRFFCTASPVQFNNNVDVVVKNCEMYILSLLLTIIK